ncbi:MAG: STN domain-containing protein [Planctomycetota bacterium]
MNRILYSLGSVLLCTAPAFAQPADLGAKLDAKLDTVAIHGMEIEAIFADLGKQAGVEIVLDEDAVECLPWGKQTRLSDVSITNASLRSALSQILDALGLKFTIRENKLVVTAGEPLQRLRRRPTWDELKLLRQLNEKDYAPDSFAGLKIQYRITSKVDAKSMLQRQLDLSGKGAVADMLETATASLNWVWFVEEDHVVIRSMEAQIANKLSRQISVRYSNVPLSQILTELAEKADVLISFEPGMMMKLPTSTAQSYTLLLQSVSIRQAVELICAETGLKYEIRTEGIHMALSDAATADPAKVATTATAPRTSPYAAKLSVPSADGGYTLEFLVRTDELPPDILEARGQMLQELIQKVRKEIAPTATQPPAQNAPSK